MPDQYQTLSEQPAQPETNTLLLDFDGFSHDAEPTPETPAPIQKENKTSNDIEFLLDLGEPNKETFNNDFFTQTSSSSATKPKNDLDDLFGSINNQTPTSNPPPSQTTNMTFDPFESLIKPASATNSANNLGVFNLSGSNTSMNKPMMSSKNNSSSNLFAQNKPNSLSNSNRATPTDPFADLTAFSNSNSSSQNNLNTNTQATKPQTPVNSNPKFNPGMPNYSSESNRPNYYIPSSKGKSAPNTSASSQQKPAAQNSYNFMSSASNAPGGTSAFDDFLPSNFAKTQEKASMSLKVNITI